MKELSTKCLLTLFSIGLYTILFYTTLVITVYYLKIGVTKLSSLNKSHLAPPHTILFNGFMHFFSILLTNILVSFPWQCFIFSVFFNGSYRNYLYCYHCECVAYHVTIPHHAGASIQLTSPDGRVGEGPWGEAQGLLPWLTGCTLSPKLITWMSRPYSSSRNPHHQVLLLVTLLVYCLFVLYFSFLLQDFLIYDSFWFFSNLFLFIKFFQFL